MRRTYERLETNNDYTKVTRGVTGSYRDCTEVKNECIMMLYMLFTDHRTNPDWILRDILDFESRGIWGEFAGISIRGQKVFIKPAPLIEYDYPEDFAIEMDRSELIRLACDWQELIKKKISSIYIYYKDGKYGVSDILPEGIE